MDKPDFPKPERPLSSVLKTKAKLLCGFQASLLLEVRFSHCHTTGAFSAA